MTLLEKIKKDSIESKHCIKKYGIDSPLMERCRICNDIVITKNVNNDFTYDNILSYISGNYCGECVAKYFSYEINNKKILVYDENRILLFTQKSYEISVSTIKKISKRYSEETIIAIIKFYSFLFGS